MDDDLGSIFLIVRFFAYTLLTDSTVYYGFLMIEFLHGLSYSLIDMSMVTICSDLFPTDMQMIAQGLLSMIKAGIGPFIFVILSGWSFQTFGGKWTFRGAAVIDAIALLAFVLCSRGGTFATKTEKQFNSAKKSKKVKK
jgi:MFS family permease